MYQESMFESSAPLRFPRSVADVEVLWRDHIRESCDKDADAFTSTSTANGASFFFYGVKVFEFALNLSGKPRMKLPGDLLMSIRPQRDGLLEDRFYAFSDPSDDEMNHLTDALRERKRYIFRHTVTETFACCNDFMRCSDHRACIHPDDRFYNGCQYRENLEAGRIFYGSNRNVD